MTCDVVQAWGARGLGELLNVRDGEGEEVGGE